MDYRWSVLHASQLRPAWYLLLGPSYARDYPIQFLIVTGARTVALARCFVFDSRP